MKCMNFNINDIVILNDLKTKKQIVDSEIIEGIEMYYMSDNTSYSYSQISMSYSNFIELSELSFKIRFFVIELL